MNSVSTVTKGCVAKREQAEASSSVEVISFMAPAIAEPAVEGETPREAGPVGYGDWAAR